MIGDLNGYRFGPDNFKCARARCKTCPFICNVEKLSEPKRSIKITKYQRTVFIQLICSVVFHVTRHQLIAWLHLSVYKPHTTHNSSIRSEEGLTLEKFTLSTQLIKPNYFVWRRHVYVNLFPRVFVPLAQRSVSIRKASVFG